MLSRYCGWISCWYVQPVVIGYSFMENEEGERECVYVYALCSVAQPKSLEQLGTSAGDVYECCSCVHFTMGSPDTVADMTKTHVIRCVCE